MIFQPILFFAFTNDHSTSAAYLKELDKERIAIEETLTANSQCQTIVRTEASRVRVEDVLNKYAGSIKIFHFSGHAESTGIELKAKIGGNKSALVEGLAPMVAQKPGVRLVFLNGCSTLGQVKKFHATDIPAVIATTKPVHDSIASEFSQAFYRNLHQGKSIKDAFQAAENALLSDHKAENLYKVRSLDFGDKKEEESLKHPYQLHLKSGQEDVQDESLADWYAEYESFNPTSEEEEELIGTNDYLLCNRKRATRDFGYNFQSESRKPKFFLLHAPYDEKSESLSKRFRVHSINDLLDFKKDMRKELVEIDFPEGRDFTHEDPLFAQYQLYQELAAKFRITGRGKGLTARKILDRKTKSDVLFIQHIIMEKDWHKEMARYISEDYYRFWDMELKEKDPHVLILIHLVYTEKANLIGKLFGGKSNTAEAEFKLISKLQPEISLLEKLNSVPKDDVIAWNKKHCPSLSDITKDLYGKKKELPMERVQEHLIAITDEFNQKLSKS